MRKPYENIHYFQKRIVSAEIIPGNTVDNFPFTQKTALSRDPLQFYSHFCEKRPHTFATNIEILVIVCIQGHTKPWKMR